MPARIEWTEAALARLIELTDPLGRRDPSAARRLVARLMDRVEDLARFPRMGPPWTPAEDDAVRRLVIDQHVLYHELAEADALVRVLWVQHGRQRPPRELGRSSPDQ
ncbi:MAG: type II toxin-antitoxin system RelE/ParE family toxin [Alphaproteobacteria bacterium]|nr:type II toxin-antitoxin system RelE/ParE family toxin [Alphaproteobacteria bacterium]